MEYFEELLKRPALKDPMDIPPACHDLPIICGPTAPAEEIRKVIMQLKNGNATGPDDIPTKALKVDIKTYVEMLYLLSAEIWEKNEVPTEKKKGCLIKLPKRVISLGVQKFKLQGNTIAVRPW